MSEITEIGIGWTDGSRFIGVKPPLTEEEIVNLRVDGFLQGVAIEQVEVEPACTLLRFGSTLTGAEGATRMAERRARELRTQLWGIRGGDIHLNPVIIPLQGPNSSPFNPVTQ